MTRRLLVLVVLLTLAIALPLAGWLAAPALAPALHDLPLPVLFPVPTPVRGYGPFVVPAHPADLRAPVPLRTPCGCPDLYNHVVIRSSAPELAAHLLSGCPRLYGRIVA